MGTIGLDRVEPRSRRLDDHLRQTGILAAGRPVASGRHAGGRPWWCWDGGYAVPRAAVQRNRSSVRYGGG